MPLADVLQLVTDLSNGLADSTSATNYSTDLVDLIGHDIEGTLVGMQTLVTGTGANSVFTAPVSAINILGVIYDGKHLPKTNFRELQHYDPYYRGSTGEPVAWYDQDKIKNTFAVAPSPVRKASSGGLPSDPTTTDPGTAALTIFYTEQRTDVHPEEELASALEIMAREFARDSDHTDRNLAQACRTLAGVLFDLVDVAVLPDSLQPAQKAALEEQP